MLMSTNYLFQTLPEQSRTVQQRSIIYTLQYDLISNSSQQPNKSTRNRQLLQVSTQSPRYQNQSHWNTLSTECCKVP
jgi:hypothetical protein